MNDFKPNSIMWYAYEVLRLKKVGDKGLHYKDVGIAVEGLGDWTDYKFPIVSRLASEFSKDVQYKKGHFKRVGRGKYALMTEEESLKILQKKKIKSNLKSNDPLLNGAFEELARLREENVVLRKLLGKTIADNVAA